MPNTINELVFLVNGNSRTGQQRAEESKKTLEDNGFKVKSFVVTTTPSKFDATLNQFLRDKEPLIAVGGGDGTMRSAAEKLAGTNSILAVFPLGTGNAWASDLGIPVGPSQSALALSRAEIETLDLGIANGKGFVNVATLGLSSLIVSNMPKGLKGQFGKIVYLPAVVRSLAQMKPFRLKVTTEGDDYEGMALQFVAAAGRTHAGALAVTRTASNIDGRLSLYALDDTDRRGMLRFGIGLLTGTHTLLKEVWSCEAATAKVETQPKKRIIIDGEPSGTTPLALSMRSQSLRVLVPIKEPDASSH